MAKPVLLRFRLHDYGDGAESWGWSIDDVEIKEQAPTSVEIGLSATPSGAGSITGTGIDCTGSCTATYQYNWDVSGREWASITSDFNSATHSVSASPGGNYAEYANSVMILAKPIDLSGATAQPLPSGTSIR